MMREGINVRQVKIYFFPLAKGVNKEQWIVPNLMAIGLEMPILQKFICQNHMLISGYRSSVTHLWRCLSVAKSRKKNKVHLLVHILGFNV